MLFLAPFEPLLRRLEKLRRADSRFGERSPEVVEVRVGARCGGHAGDQIVIGAAPVRLWESWSGRASRQTVHLHALNRRSSNEAEENPTTTVFLAKWPERTLPNPKQPELHEGKRYRATNEQILT